MKTIIAVHSSLKSADAWQIKGNQVRVYTCLSSALTTYLEISLTNENDPESGKEWLIINDFLSVLQRYFEVLHFLGNEVAEERLPSSVISNNYNYIVFAHAAWCLGEFTTGEAFVKFAARQDVADSSTPFWREYTRGMNALVQGKEYQVKELQLRGQEKYWVAYLHMIATRSTPVQLQGAKADIKKLFSKRNHDKTIRDDHYGIEGSSHAPVKWDLRGHSLLNYMVKIPDQPLS
ncbi:MAG: hypothetical protein ACAI35_18775 [Candidatus Methylacidiphilales bacterium]|nr:hypothetical protein [Candidatus Methylacidiphilales bacterium]